MYEPCERFEHLGQKYYWNPDCMFVHRKIIYACEVQRSLPPGKAWPGKWKAYNLYFGKGYYKTAAYQKWANTITAPQFLVITKQPPETVKQGFEIEGRDLIVVGEMK